MKQNLLFNQASALGKRLAMVLTILFTLGVGSMLGATYTITFKSANSDSSSDLGANPTVSNVVSSGASYVASFSSCSKMYVGKSGIKLGTGSATGTINFTLATNYQNNIKSIKVVSAKYGSDTGTLTLYNGSTSLKSGITPGTDYTHTFSAPTKVTSIKLTTSTKRAYITSIVITTEEATSYTVNWTINPTAGGSLSATTGNSITVTPNAAYTYGNPAYTVSPAEKATVSKSDNTFTASPTENCTIQINMVEKQKNTYIDQVQGNSESVKYDTHSTPTLADKTQVTTGTCEQLHWHFMGWVTEANKANPTDANIVKAGASVKANGTTYYAVWAKGTTTGGGSTAKQYSFDITKGDFNTTSYAANNNSKTSTAKASDNSTKSVSWTSNQVMQQSSTMQWQSSKGYIYNTTDLGNITNITITSTAGTFTTYYGTSQQPSQETSVGTGNGYFQIKVGSATGKVSNIKVTFTQIVDGETTTTYSDYITSCSTQTVLSLRHNQPIGTALKTYFFVNFIISICQRSLCWSVHLHANN